MKATFPKSEKLKGKKAIEALFKEGRSVKAYPFVVRYRINPESEYHRAAFSVPAKKMRKAAHRNLIRRRMREAYRLAKYQLYENREDKLDLMFIYIPREAVNYHDVEKGMDRAINLLTRSGSDKTI